MDDQDASITVLDQPSKWTLSHAESFSKILALLAVATYATGFAIITVYNGTNNIPVSSPLKPQFAYVGIVFMLLTVIPITATFPIIRVLFKKETGVLYIASSTLWYAWLSLLIGLTARFLFDFQGQSPVPHNKWSSLVLSIGSGIIYGIGSRYHDADRTAKAKRKYFIYILAILNVCILFYNGIPRGNEFTPSQVILWLFLTGVIGGYITHDLLNEERRKKVNLPYAAFYIVYLLSIYPTYIFPHIKSSFAGGSPKVATIYFSKSSSLLPCHSLVTKILLEEEAGIYIKADDSRTIYFPRSAVDAISYSDRPLPQWWSGSCP